MASVRRLQRRYPGFLMVMGCLTLTGVASAAALNGLGSSLLGSGAAAVSVCDADGFSVTHVLTGSTVTDVTVNGIDANCAAGALSVTLTNAVDAAVASGGPVTVPGGGGSVTVAITPNIDVSAFTNHHIGVVGP